MIFGPLDPLLAVLYVALKIRPLRSVVLFFGLIPAILYALPAQPCGCMPSLFMRCSSSGRTPAYYAAMKSDLKNLASQQEIYYSEHYTYSADVEELAFVSSSGVRITVFASPRGWSARTTHDALPDIESCAMYYGTPPVAIDQLDGAAPAQAVCTPYR